MSTQRPLTEHSCLDGLVDLWMSQKYDGLLAKIVGLVQLIANSATQGLGETLKLNYWQERALPSSSSTRGSVVSTSPTTFTKQYNGTQTRASQSHIRPGQIS